MGTCTDPGNIQRLEINTVLKEFSAQSSRDKKEYLMITDQESRDWQDLQGQVVPFTRTT